MTRPVESSPPRRAPTRPLGIIVGVLVRPRQQRQAPVVVGAGVIDPANPAWASLPVLQPGADHLAGDEEREFLDLMNAVKVIDTQPSYEMPGDVIGQLREILNPPSV